MTVTSKYTEGLGERIRFIRKNANIDQVEFAKQLEVSRQSISGYETERLMPSGKILEAISDQFGINPWWLLYGVGSAETGSEEVTSEKTMARLLMEELSPAQLSLIEYIKADKEAAKQLARMLWDKVLKEPGGEKG